MKAMTTFIFLGASFFVMATGFAESYGGELGHSEIGTEVRLSGKAESFLSPDTAYVHFSVNHEGTDGVQVQRSHEEAFSQIQTALSEYSIEGLEFRLYTYTKGDSQSEKDQRITVALSRFFIEIADLSKLGNVIARAVEAGVTEVSSIRYENSTYTEVYAALLARAYQSALRKARIFATQMDKHSIEVVSITELSREAMGQRQDMDGLSVAKEMRSSALFSDLEQLPEIKVQAIIDVIFRVH